MSKKYPHLEVRGSKIDRRGVFAARLIKKGERIIEYTGKKMTPAMVERSNSDYIFEVNSKLCIDGRNTARYINHSCDENAVVEIEKGRIYIDAKRDIKKGEEIVYSYSYTIEEAEGYKCLCGSKRCIGVILDECYWPEYRRLQKKKKAAINKLKKTKSKKS